MEARTGYRHWNKARSEWSPRQREVLDLLAKGCTNGQIAERLDITLDGAKWHVSELIAELNARSRDEVAEYWRHERNPMNRLAHALLPLVAIKPMALGAAAVAGAAAIAVGAVVIASGGGGNNALTTSDASPTPTATTVSSETPGTSSSAPQPVDADPQLLQYIESAGIPLDRVSWYGESVTLEGYEVTLEAGYVDEFRTVFFVHARPVDGDAAETLPWVHITTAYLVDGEGRAIDVNPKLGRVASGGPLESRTRFSFEALSSFGAGEGLSIRFNELMGPNQQYAWANWAFEVDLPVQPDAVTQISLPTDPFEVGDLEFEVTSLVRSGDLLHLEWRTQGPAGDTFDWRPGEGPPPMPMIHPAIQDADGAVLQGRGGGGVGISPAGINSDDGIIQTEGRSGFALAEPGTYTLVFGDPAAPEVEWEFDIP